MDNLVRYSVIKSKNPREIVLLRGHGCFWKKCTFCDYHLDCSENEEENFYLNKSVIDKITGVYENLEVINSGSFCELDKKTLDTIKKVCLEKNIKKLCFEIHWAYREKLSEARKFFSPTVLNFKIGVETFDLDMREKILKKGFGNVSAEEISRYCDQVCLLFGISGQTLDSMKLDMETALKYFRRVCVNIMCKNTTNIVPDKNVIETFRKFLLPLYVDNTRVEILFDNTDFGVGDL